MLKRDILIKVIKICYAINNSKMILIYENPNKDSAYRFKTTHTPP